jgi:rhodanese-related sulfurtransferase
MACQRRSGINHEPHWSSPEQGDTPCTHYRRFGEWIARRSARIDMGLNAFCRLRHPQHRRTATEDQRYEEASQPAPSTRSRGRSQLLALSRVDERNSAEIARVMASYFQARDELEPVSRDELLDRLRRGTATVLDVRPEDEFAHGHLPHALNIPLSELERRLAELPADQEIVAYCRGSWCVLSFEAVALLRQRGYRVRRLEDGFPEWTVAGLAVEKVPVR